MMPFEVLLLFWFGVSCASVATPLYFLVLTPQTRRLGYDGYRESGIFFLFIFGILIFVAFDWVILGGALLLLYVPSLLSIPIYLWAYNTWFNLSVEDASASGRWSRVFLAASTAVPSGTIVFILGVFLHFLFTWDFYPDDFSNEF
jgi:hypothetical protein